MNAEADARACIAVDDSWWRAHARLGAAREAVSDFLGASRAYAVAALRAGKNVEAEPMRSASARTLNAFETAAAATNAEAAGAPRPTLASMSRDGRVRIDIAAALARAPTLWELAAAHPSVRLVRERAGGKGRALVASRAIRQFEPVIVDAAVAFYPQYGDSVGPAIAALAGRPYFIRPGAGRVAADAERTWTTEAVEGVLLQLAPFSAESGSGFTAPAGDFVTAAQLFHAVAALNALSAVTDEDAPAQSRRVQYISPIASLVNHDCAPNCSYEGFWDTERGAPGVRIFAEVDIAEGDEITISYVDRALPTAARAARLSDYNFSCVCARCTSSRVSGDDSLIFACQSGTVACGGRLLFGAAACKACGAAPPYEIATAAGANAAKDAWLAAAAAQDDVRSHLTTMNTRAATALPCPALHIGDQSRFAALYAQLGGLWMRDNEASLRCAVSAAVVDSTALGRSGRGPVYASDALLIAGHYHALAAAAEASQKSPAAAVLRATATGYYRRAATLFRAAFGDRDPRATLADDLAARPPTLKLDIERAEQRRLLASSSWVRLYNLEPAVVTRWSAPCVPDSTDAFALEALTEMEAETRTRWLPWRTATVN